MNILMITENDPAGMGIAFTKALNAYTDHTCRLITKKVKYNFDYEKDIHVPDLDGNGYEEIRDLLKKADIIHFHILADERMELGPIRIRDYIKGKKILHHHHGHPDFRNHSEKYREKYRKLKRRVIVSTPDLLRLLPEATWQPNHVPIDDTGYRPSLISENGMIRICHSPTRKNLKNTAEFIRAGQSLQSKYHNIEMVIIENQPHKDCLKIKQASHIHFDHMQGYFGVSSLESLSQGKPVIAGLDEWNISCIKSFTRSHIVPWLIARSQDELEKVIKRQLKDKEQRQACGNASRHFMEEHWTQQRALEILLDVYGRL